MIRFVGISNKAQSKKDTNKRIKKISGLFTFCVFSFLFVYLLFDTTDIGIKKFEEPRAAVAKIMYLGGHGTGFLISNEVLVTARHCVVDENDQINKNITVQFTNAGKEYEKAIKATVLWLPSEYGNYIDDFALLKLSSPVKNIKPLVIADEVEDPLNYSPTCDVYGYQGIAGAKELQSMARAKELQSMAGSKGNIHLPLAVTRYMLNDTTFFELEDGVSQGTSGAPVIDQTTKEVIGIVVWELNETMSEVNYDAGYAEKAYQIFQHPEAIPLKLNY